MKQHGRKSAASLDVEDTGDPMAVLRPPPYLSATETKLFVEVVANVPSGQFSASDVYLLTSFVRVTLLCHQAPKALAKATDKTRSQRVKILEQMVKMQALLATKLRLTELFLILPANWMNG